jgi:cytoskeletal protein CcmA (bactofilin family)
MATYVNNLRLKEIATGDEEGTWGASTNTNLELIADAFGSGTEAITTNANTHTTTIADGAADEGRAIFLKYTGDLDSDCTITIAPNTVNKLWLIENATGDSGSSGPYNIIISQGSGANITIGNGKVAAVFTDGAGSGAAVLDAFADLELMTSLTVGTDAIVGDDLTLKSDAAVLGFGADTDTTLTHVADTGLLLNSTRQLQFNDSSQYINAPSATVLDINATDEIELNATAVDLNGTLDVSGTITVAGNADLNGDLDVDGTTNLDAVDIDGAVQIDSTVTVGVDDTGYDVKFFGDTASAYMLWDASTDDLVLAGAAGIDLAGDLDVDGTTNLDVVDIDGAVDMASTLTLAGNADFNGDLDVDGTTNLDNTDVDGTLVVDGSNISLDSTSTLNIDNSNTSNGITIGTATSGVPVSIGHTTSEVTVNDNLTVTGTLTLGSGAELTEAELEMLDGITAGTVAASKAVVVDSNKDITGFRNITLTGELDAATLDVSGAIDVAGTANLDVVDIDGAVDMASTLQVDGNLTTSADVSVGDDLSLASDAAVLNFGADSDVSLTHVADTGLLLNSTRQLQFYDASQRIAAVDATTLSIGATDEIDLTATALDLNGNVDISGTTTLNSKLTVTSAGEELADFYSTDTDAYIRLRDSNDSLYVSSDNGVASFGGSTGATATNLNVNLTSGAVGIGTTSPSGTFDAQNNQNNTSHFYLRNTDTTDTSSRAYLNIISGNRTFQLGAINADHAYINAPSGANLYFQDGGTTNMTIKNNGYVGIGETDPDSGLHLKNSATAGSRITLEQTTASLTSVIQQGSSGLDIDASGATNIITFNTNGSERARFFADGEFAINSTSDTGRQLTVKHDIALEASNSTNYYQVYTHTDDSFRINYNAAGNDEFMIDSSGNVIMQATAKLYLDGGGNTYIHESSADTMRFFCGGTSRFQVQADGIMIPSGNNLYLDNGGDTYIVEGSANVMRFYAGGSKQFEVSGTNMTVVGALSKGSGSFRIDHPLDSMKDTHDLVHSFIEGPRADLMYRGSVQLSGGTATVDLDDAATMTDGTWELLCRDPQVWVQNEDGWTQVRGSVSGSTLTITAQDEDCTDTVSWLVVAERQDEHMMDTNWTDDNGRVIVEPEKPAEDEE